MLLLEYRYVRQSAPMTQRRAAGIGRNGVEKVCSSCGRLRAVGRGRDSSSFPRCSVNTEGSAGIVSGIPNVGGENSHDTFLIRYNKDCN